MHSDLVLLACMTGAYAVGVWQGAIAAEDFARLWRRLSKRKRRPIAVRNRRAQ